MSKLSLYEEVIEGKNEHICENCIHFDLCESEFSSSSAKPDDPACEDYEEEEGSYENTLSATEN